MRPQLRELPSAHAGSDADVLSRSRRVQDELRCRHGDDAAAQHALGGSGAGRAVHWYRPAVSDEYKLSVLNLILIAVVGAIGLNILVGYTDQVSIGHGAFMSVGAYTAAHLVTQLDAPFWISVPAGGLMAAAIGALVGIPSLRIKGLYLAIATLGGAAHHRMDDQPRVLGVGRHAGVDPGAAARRCSARS